MKDKRTFYKAYTAMFLVIVGQNVITLGVNLLDNVMLGAYSESALAGVAAVNQVQFLFQQILLAFGDGAVILGTRYFGTEKSDAVKSLGRLTMYCGLGVAVMLFLAAWLRPEQMMRIFTDSPEIIREGSEYLRIVKWGFVCFAITQILLATLRIAGEVRISLVLSVVALIVNGSLNYLLIYGTFGMPEMGVKGAAWGTLVARIAELTALLFYIGCREKKLKLRLRDYTGRCGNVLRKYAQIIWPLLIFNTIWGLNTAGQNAILGHMANQAIAANSICSTLFLLVKSMMTGSAVTSSYFTGKILGEGRKQEIYSYVYAMQKMFVLTGIIAGICLYGMSGPVLGLYKIEPDTRKMAAQFLHIMAFMCIPMSYQMPTNAGIIKGGGDTKYCMLLDLISIGLIVMPVSLFAAFYLKVAPVTVFVLLNADQIFKILPAFVKIRSGSWIKELT